MGELDPSYTSLCSSLTLQTEKRGFFLPYADSVTEAVGIDWLKNKFVKLKSDEDRIKICYSEKKLVNVVHEPLDHLQQLFRPKSAAVAQQKRKDGELELELGRPQAAVTLLNQSVMRSPPLGVDKSVDSGLSLPLALAARAEALRELREFSLALADLQLAVKEGHPEALRFQLYWRMARCYCGQGQVQQATVALQVAQKLLEQQRQKMDVKQFENNERVLQQELDTLSDNTSTAPPSAVTLSTVSLPTLSGGENPNLPGAANCVGVSSTTEAGRFVIATSPIKTGDTVLVQNPYAACLLTEMSGSHCHHCFKSLISPVGCPKCSGVAFCGTACRDEACSSYHKFECAYMDILIGSGMSILCHVALRMVTQFSLQFLLSPDKTKANKEPEKSFEAIYKLATHSDRRPVEDFFHRTLMAIFLLKVLQKAGYFPEPSQGIALGEAEARVGALLLTALQLLQFNAHEIYETRMCSRTQFRSSRPAYIGVAIYPTAALFNHDCYAAVARYFVGKTIVLRALRPLGAGDVLPENYGPNFVKFPLAKRARTLLSRYWFRCGCASCRQDWPPFERQDNAFRMQCPSAGCSRTLVVSERALDGLGDHEQAQGKKGRKKLQSASSIKCSRCGAKVALLAVAQRVEALEQVYERALAVMERGAAAEAAALLQQYVEGTHSLAGLPPRKNLHLAQEALRVCFADQGNVFVAPPTDR